MIILLPVKITWCFVLTLQTYGDNNLSTKCFLIKSMNCTIKSMNCTYDAVDSYNCVYSL